MVKVIVIAETITSGIIGWVDIDKFDLSAKLLFDGVECDEVVTLDNKVFTNDTVLISLKFANLIF